MTTMSEAGRRFIPGMGVEWLLPVYDPLTRLTGLDRSRRALVEQARLQPGQRVLDIGCGTGSLAVLIAQAHPAIEVAGLDPDPKALSRASRKARRAGVTIAFERGFSDALPFGEGSFDRVFSSFMFHHLSRDEKARTLREVRRVLAKDGSLHLLDFAGPGAADDGQRRHGLHAHGRLRDNDASTVIGLMAAAGFVNPAVAAGRAVFFGSLRITYYRAAARS